MTLLTNNILPFLVIICALVAIHEYGHYAAARTFNIAVRRFSVGMGPVLLRKRDRRGTEWALSALPIGGYVSMVEKPEDLTPELTGIAYTATPRWARASVLLAGPVANLIVGFGLLFGHALISETDVTPPIVREVMAGSPAQAAGLLPGDRIVKLDEVKVDTFRDVSSQIQVGLDTPVVVTVSRDGAEVSFRIVPEHRRATLDNGRVLDYGQIGIAGPAPVVGRLGLNEAWSHALKTSVHMTVSTYHAISQLLTGSRSPDSMTGMIGMAEVTGKIVAGPADQDSSTAQIVLRLASFAALISLNLALVNLLPVPVLDGGQILVLAVEGTIRRPLPPQFKKSLMVAGVAIVALLFLFTTVNDARFMV